MISPERGYWIRNLKIRIQYREIIYINQHRVREHRVPRSKPKLYCDSYLNHQCFTICPTPFRIRHHLDTYGKMHNASVVLATNPCDNRSVGHSTNVTTNVLLMFRTVRLSRRQADWTSPAEHVITHVASVFRSPLRVCSQLLRPGLLILMT